MVLCLFCTYMNTDSLWFQHPNLRLDPKAVQIQLFVKPVVEIGWLVWLRFTREFALGVRSEEEQEEEAGLKAGEATAKAIGGLEKPEDDSYMRANSSLTQRVKGQ